jgi:antitoxin ParD1/3/4
MDTMNIAIPEGLKEFVQVRVHSGGYSSASEYVRELIRLDQRQSARDALESELLRGLASRPPEKMTARDWAEIRSAVPKRGSLRKRR